MGKKIFISYKYGDSDVDNTYGPDGTQTYTVRDYVTIIQNALNDKTDNIYKGESDGEDLSKLSNDTIWEKLKNRIYDSTLTIIMVSKGMREQGIEEKYQWIPQEISYSLKEMKRKNKNGDLITSRTNALLAVILPDKNGDYSYFVTDKNCCEAGCRCFNSYSNSIFSIMASNLFNIISFEEEKCGYGRVLYKGECNYMKCVKWDEFKDNMEQYIEEAYKIQSNQEDYDIHKEV